MPTWRIWRKILGNPYQEGFAFSMTDWDYDEQQLNVLALQILTLIVDADPNLGDLVKAAVHDAYAKQHRQVAQRLSDALQPTD